MSRLYAVVAFALLWLVLAGFFVGLFRMLRDEGRRRRRGEQERWEHGL